MTKEITIKGKYDIEAPSQMVAMAKVLKTHIVNQNLYTKIVNKNYAHVEGWQFAGGLMGLYPKVAKVENLSTDKEKKWKADVELIEIKSGKVVGFGSAICSNAENKKKTFDEYAILSMAQTRAIGKAYRNLIGWVMKLAGYEATPSEEMFKMGETIIASPVGNQAASGKSATSKEPIIECHECAAHISPQVAEYSKRMFKKQLCRDCQKGAKITKR